MTDTAGEAAWPRNEKDAERSSTGPRAASAARPGCAAGSTLETAQVMGSEPAAGTSSAASYEVEPFECLSRTAPEEVAEKERPP